MRAYWFDNLPGDQRQPHDSGRTVPPEKLSELGILHYNFPSVDPVDKLAAERQYKNRDVITISPTTLPGYEEKVKNFFHEHLHEDEEIRYIIDGSGFFDVRGKDDDWIRISLEKGDLMIMPAGIYHRFTTDEKDYTKAMRLFKDDPKWTPLNRGEETDGNEYRKAYLQSRDAVAA
ncbi:1,2-dihydroxy-3-keto-5-methylthiopentene dioxygenase [Venturia effusa]|uniref:Acireductone dioxygenase n=1 Tax=Venturia effusa TaxID=50376 RepID=A0A517L475_9PEZI|nr:1,2-dihydroxy-3-keto-5-methylthiopentene dioxygenase [Venturia effusa]